MICHGMHGEGSLWMVTYNKSRGWHDTNSCIGRTGSYSETKVGGGEMHNYIIR